MNEPTKRTQAELEELINDWRRDPCWDLSQTEDYEAHASELEAYNRAYFMKSHNEELQVETLFQDLNFGTTDEDLDLAEMLGKGWEILNLTVTTLGTDKHDGLWRVEHHRVITLKRIVQIPTDREELLDEALVALMASASDAPEFDEADRLARENHALEMLYADAMSGESEKSE